MREVLGPMLVMSALSVVMAGVGVWGGRRWRRGVATGMCVAAVGVLSLHAAYLNDNLVTVRWLPVADAVVWGNPQVPAGALLAGVAWSLLKTPRWQRVVLAGAVAGLAVWRAWGPVMGAPPAAVSERRWEGEVCRQSTLSTCSAAAAATALRAVGIESTEAEMARLCLTREAGTTNLGLYRGMKIKTEGTGYGVEAFAGTVEELAALPDGPAVLSIGVTVRGARGVPLAALRPGNRHSVVLLGRSEDGSLAVGDPYTGRRQRYSPAQLEKEWDGRAIRIVRR